MKTLWPVILALTAFATASSAQPGRTASADLASGVYDGSLLIGFEPATGVVSGYFREEQGKQPSFSCIFYLRGRLQGAEAAIKTYFPETPTEKVIKGRLAVEAGGRLRIRLAEEHGGCWNVQHFADEKEPAEFMLDGPRRWRSVAVVRSDKAYFFDGPASGSHRNAYLVKGDGVGVRAAQPGWLQVDFVGGRRTVSGWIRQSDVYPAGP